MNKTIEHEHFGTFELKGEVTFGDVETYAEKRLGYDVAEHTKPRADRATIESAVEAGILVSKVDLDNSHPAMVLWLAGEIAGHIAEAYEIPKN